MLNFIRYIIIFGYSTTQRFTMIIPSQFFIYNYTKVFVNQSSFITITVCIYCKRLCVYMFICDQHIFCFRNNQ